MVVLYNEIFVDLQMEFDAARIVADYVGYRSHDDSPSP
jgi:hypothetical protein